MAANTVPNPVRLVDTNCYTFFGYPVPANVTAIEMRDRLDGVREIRWRSKGSSDIHSIELDVITDETILAALAAMRLSC